jgi:hypothetical protein
LVPGQPKQGTTNSLLFCMVLRGQDALTQGA